MLDRFIDALQCLPGIGRKSAQRIAFQLLQRDRERALKLADAIREAMDWTARNNRFYSGIGEVFPGIVPPAAGDLYKELSSDSITREESGSAPTFNSSAYDGWFSDSTRP